MCVPVIEGLGGLLVSGVRVGKTRVARTCESGSPRCRFVAFLWPPVALSVGEFVHQTQHVELRHINRCLKQKQQGRLSASRRLATVEFLRALGSQSGMSVWQYTLVG